MIHDEDAGANPSTAYHLNDIVAARLSRRVLLLGGVATAAAGALAMPRDGATQSMGPSSLTFRELPKTLDTKHHVAAGYDTQILIRWGDRVAGGAPAFSAGNLTAAAQERQFGYNCDFLAWFPLPAGSQSSDHGILAVNHEYTNANLMFAGLGAGRDASRKVSAAQADIEIAAHGASFLELRRSEGRWQVVENGRYNRRITGTTLMAVAGPAAGHEKLRTRADPSGRNVLGMFNNCGGGWTPWGTLLTCEENFNMYFGGNVTATPDADMFKRYGVSATAVYGWDRHLDRFSIDREPHEPHRFGWVVEIDPYDPASMPVKRTALGRFKHEAATTIVNPDGRLVVYSGDDEVNEYVYKFVTVGRYNPNDREANRNLLDDGTLFVAQFLDDGSVKWLPLVHGQGPLTSANGFGSQAEVLIFARRAADLLGATPMDRPEDVETNPVNGRVYVMLTNNSRRAADKVNKANPRANNRHGQIIEIVPPGGSGAQADHAATEAKWNMFLLAGKPGIDAGAMYHRATTENGWLSCPDNCLFDAKGRMWVLTDGAQPAAGIADGIYGMDTDGNGRALPKLFFTAPTGAEICAAILTPDQQTMFVTVQHPGEDPGSTFETPSTRWPDFRTGMPPRPSVVAVTRRGGGVIGS